MNIDNTLVEMASTFNQRNAVYKDNYIMVGKVMAAFFPDGVTLKTPADFEKWSFFEAKIIKLTRFVASDLTHEDSILDDGVMSVMMKTLMEDTNNPIKSRKGI